MSHSVCIYVISPKMSKHIAIFALVAFCLSTIVAVDATAADKDLLQRQKSVLELLWHIDQPEIQPALYAEGKDYSIEAHLADYTDEKCVKEFLRINKADTLPRGELFSVFYPAILEQAKALFRVFYHCKDFPTLYKTAAWARIHINEGLFAYAFSVAVTHRKDTHQIRVPAYSEINPHLYFDDGVIRQAYNAKILTGPTDIASGKWTIIPENDNSCPYSHQPDRVLSYYTEDIGVNNLPYYAHLQHPFWMSADESEYIFAQRGDVYLWSCRVQLARYYMERLSNDFGDIEDFDWYQRIPYGFIPSLSYHNGFSVPHREKDSHVSSHNYKWLKALRDYEHRISAAIDMGQVILENGTFLPIHSPDGIYTLGNLIEGNVDSVNFDLYGSYDRVARSVLGFSPKPINAIKVFPSVMQQYGLDHRDPMFWSMSKKIAGFYEQFVSKLPKYTNEDLAFPGVKIESVSVDKVTTFFTPNEYLISGAVKLQNPNDMGLIKARKNRLTHKPYKITIKVASESDASDSKIRIFLGPKYNVHREVYDIAENWKHFFMVDEFSANLKAGSNTFERSSDDARGGSPDEVSGDVFYRKILNALAGNETYEVPEYLYGYPKRMFIPKGKKEGFPMQFFVFVSPKNDKHSGAEVMKGKYIGNTASGFPLDRPVSSCFTQLPNGYFQDFNVYHTSE